MQCVAGAALHPLSPTPSSSLQLSSCTFVMEIENISLASPYLLCYVRTSVHLSVWLSVCLVAVRLCTIITVSTAWRSHAYTHTHKHTLSHFHGIILIERWINATLSAHIHTFILWAKHPLLIEYQYLSDAVKSYAFLCDYHYLHAAAAGQLKNNQYGYSKRIELIEFKFKLWMLERKLQLMAWLKLSLHFISHLSFPFFPHSLSLSLCSTPCQSTVSWLRIYSYECQKSCVK